MKILIVSYYYPPISGIAPLRPYSWVKYWTRAGHDVTVLSSEDALRDEVPLVLPTLDAEVWYPRYFNPLRPLVPLLRLARPRRAGDNGGVRDLEAQGLRGALIRFRSKTGVLTTWRMPNFSDGWIPSAILRALQSGQRWDVVVSTSPPYGCHLVAYALKTLNISGAWVADFRDQWTNSHYTGLPPFRSVERALERQVLQHADAVTTVSQGVAETLLAEGRRIDIVENGFDRTDLDRLPAERVFPHDDQMRLVYTGTLYPGLEDPAPLFAAVRYLRGQDERARRLRLVFAGVVRDVPRLASEYGLTDQVDHLGKVDRETALRMQRDANGLLFFRRKGEGILTGKLFEYLNAQAPILHIGDATGDAAAALIEQCGAGVACGADPAQIGAVLRSFAHKQLTIDRRQDEIARYSRSAKAELMLAVLERVTARPGSTPGRDA